MKNRNEVLNSNPPSQEAVSERAREIWHARGCPEGRDTEIWFEAERLLTDAATAPALTSPSDLVLPGSGNAQQDVVTAKAVQQKQAARAPQRPAVHEAPRAKTVETGKPLWSKPHSS
jgi:hypothetical protein